MTTGESNIPHTMGIILLITTETHGKLNASQTFLGQLKKYMTVQIKTTLYHCNTASLCMRRGTILEELELLVGIEWIEQHDCHQYSTCIS